MMESARRWSTRWVELGWVLISTQAGASPVETVPLTHRSVLQTRRGENIAAVAGLEKWESRVVCGISKLRGKVGFDFSMK
jgi:hypothetical protein